MRDNATTHPSNRIDKSVLVPAGECTRRRAALPAEAYDCFMVGAYMGLTEYKHSSRRLCHGQPAAVLALVKDKPFGGAAEALSLTIVRA